MTLVRLAKEEEASACPRCALCRREVRDADAEPRYLASINGIVSFAHLYKIRLLMLIHLSRFVWRA